MVGFLGATPLNRRSQAAKYFLAPAGAALEALRKGEFCNYVAKEGRPAREGVPNSNEVAAFVWR
ncbi:MAG: hypothetical protein IJ035_08830 [Oscillospiraceae bacterium]|nr:hypothetical protein [Oscillospiraceae bacterium]